MRSGPAVMGAFSIESTRNRETDIRALRELRHAERFVPRLSLLCLSPLNGVPLLNLQHPPAFFGECLRDNRQALQRLHGVLVQFDVRETAAAA